MTPQLFEDAPVWKQKETQLQEALWELIEIQKRPEPEVIAWAVNNNPRSARDGARLKRMGLTRGVPDFHFLINGKYHTLEIKTKNGRPSKDQLAWMAALRAHGAICDIAYGWDQCVHILKTRGVLR